MSDRLVRIELENGLNQLHCPVCGHPIAVSEEGLAEEMCGHVLFVMDSVVQEYEHVPMEHQKVFEGDPSFEKLLRKLPATAVIFVFEEPARGGGHDASSVGIGIDLRSAGMTEEGDS